MFSGDVLDDASMPLGMALAIPGSDGSVELKAVAIDAALRRQGIGKRMLAAPRRPRVRTKLGFEPKADAVARELGTPTGRRCWTRRRLRPYGRAGIPIA